MCYLLCLGPGIFGITALGCVGTLRNMVPLGFIEPMVVRNRNVRQFIGNLWIPQGWKGFHGSMDPPNVYGYWGTYGIL